MVSTTTITERRHIEAAPVKDRSYWLSRYKNFITQRERITRALAGRYIGLGPVQTNIRYRADIEFQRMALEYKQWIDAEHPSKLTLV